MESNPDTHGEGYLVEGDPEETAEQERERRGDDESPERERAEVRSSLEAGGGKHDKPAAGSGLNRGGYAPREHDV